MPNRRGRTREKAQTPSSSGPASTAVVVQHTAAHKGAERDGRGNGRTCAVVMSVSSSRSSEGRADPKRQGNPGAIAKPLKARTVSSKTGHEDSGLAKFR